MPRPRDPGPLPRAPPSPTRQRRISCPEREGQWPHRSPCGPSSCLASETCRVYSSEHQGRKARAGRPVRQLLGTSFAHSAGMLSPVPASGTPTQARQWAAGAGRTGSLGSLQAGAPLPCPGFAVCRWQAALLGTGGGLWQEGLRGSPEDTEGPQVSMSRQLQPSPAPVKDSSMLPSPPLRPDGP